MSEAFLANTSTQGLSPLGTAPQRSYELISGTIRDALGDRHAAVFAEPVATQYGDRFDWYAVADGKPQRLDALDDETRQLVQDDLDGLVADIAALGQDLLAKTNPDEQRLGEALSNAVRYPGAECVYVLSGGGEMQPVLLNWAWVSDTQAVVAGDLSGTEGAARAKKTAAIKAAAAAQVAAAAAPVAPPPRADERDRGPFGLWWLLWLGWLLLLIMIAAILYLMVEACALRIPGVAGYCPPPGPVASVEERLSLSLRDRIATAERQIAIADRACQPKQQASLIPDADQTRLADRGAREGKLTVSLLWDSIADLHLDVRCPAGDTINYGKQNACGGVLDVGGNHSRTTAQADAIESMYFDAPQTGQYSVSVSLYNPYGGATTEDFRLRVRNGDKIETYNGRVVRGQGPWTKTFTVGKGN
ncbi:hypothetical protein [Ascidiaceihabitans sp.]|uniref:hypothetical protein n=1 Tax=Ascidiaceihabitans sp. TaxID=1872644 RepID=UPI003299DCA2